MYRNIQINHFRGITNLKIKDFRRLNLLVGENNCGKTTILEALFLLTGAANAELPVRINSFRGVDIIDDNSLRSIFYNLDIAKPIELSADVKYPSVRRELSIKPLIESSKKLPKDKIIRDNSALNYGYTSFFQKVNGLNLKYRYKPENGSRVKDINTTIVINEEGRPEIKMPTNYTESYRGVFVDMSTLFSDLYKRFNDIQIKKQTDKIIKVLQQIEPHLNNLSLGTNGLIYCDVGLKRLIPLNDIGTGMVRVLAILLAISYAQDGVVLIDEIENGLYPSTQEILWKAVYKASQEYNVQVFATTHSIECVKALISCSNLEMDKDEIRLFRVEKKGDKMRAVSFDYTTLVAALDSDWEIR